MSGMREMERVTTAYAQTNGDLDFTGIHSLARQQADDMMRSQNVLHDPAKMNRFMKELEATGVLPEVAWRETDQLDANGDHKITRDELDNIISHPDNYDPMTVLAAKYVHDDMNDISKHGAMTNSPTDYVTVDEIENDKDMKKANRKADPDQMFGNGWDNDNDAAADAAGDLQDKMNNGIAGGAASAVRDGASQLGKPAQDDDAAGGSCGESNQQDHPDRSHSGRNRGQSGNHGKHESDDDGVYKVEYNDDGKRIDHAKKGEGVWQIAERICKQEGRPEDVSKEWVKIMKANHFKKNQVITDADEVIIPGYDYD